MAKSDVRHDRPQAVRGERVEGDEAVSGIVHVIRDEAEIDKFREGEILVAAEIPETWCHLFSLAKAIITETADVPVHVVDAANVLALPVITGVPQAESVLRSGDIVMMHVDGTIQRLKDRREPDSPMRVSVPVAVHARQFANQVSESDSVDGDASVVRLNISHGTETGLPADVQLDDDDSRESIG